MKKIILFFYFIPLFGYAQIQKLDQVASKTIGTASALLGKFASLQEKQAEGQTFYFLAYWDHSDESDTKVIKFTGGQEVLDELYKLLLDAIAKPKGGKTFIKLGDQLVSIEVKKGLSEKSLDIYADVGGFQLDERQLKKLFGK